jgi:endonuclease YncB( thermonuclease family)
VLFRIAGITDGDTITLLGAEHHQHKIRLDGIDDPEMAQQFGQHQTRADRNATR